MESALARLAACGTSRGSPITPDAYAVAYGVLRDAWATPLAAGLVPDVGETGGDKDPDDAEKTRGEKPTKPVSFANEKIDASNGGGSLAFLGMKARSPPPREPRVARARAAQGGGEGGGVGQGYRVRVRHRRVWRRRRVRRRQRRFGNDGGAGGRSVDEWDVSAAREAQFAEDAVVQALVAETTALIRVGARGEGLRITKPVFRHETRRERRRTYG